MRLQHIEPHPLLKGYIEKIWLFESIGKMPPEDLKLVVPTIRTLRPISDLLLFHPFTGSVIFYHSAGFVPAAHS